MDTEDQVPNEWKPVRVCPACRSPFSLQAAACACGATRPMSRVHLTWSGPPDESRSSDERLRAEDAMEQGMNSENFVGFARAQLKWSAPGTWIVVSALASDIWLAPTNPPKPVERHEPTPAPIDVRDKVTDVLRQAGLSVLP